MKDLRDSSLHVGEVRDNDNSSLHKTRQNSLVHRITFQSDFEFRIRIQYYRNEESNARA